MSFNSQLVLKAWNYWTFLPISVGICNRVKANEIGDGFNNRLRAFVEIAQRAMYVTIFKQSAVF